MNMDCNIDGCVADYLGQQLLVHSELVEPHIVGKAGEAKLHVADTPSPCPRIKILVLYLVHSDLHV
jgi:hypothetical protein